MTVDEIRARALELPREERELLGIALLGSLETSANQAEVDSAWADEILARSEAYRSGQKSMPWTLQGQLNASGNDWPPGRDRNRSHSSPSGR